MTEKETELKELQEEFEILEKHGFSDVFHSEYDQTKQFSNKPFEVLGRVPLEECWVCDSPMWNIMCDGETFAAFPVEIIEGL
jgi:hypothetical protein